MIRIYIDNNLEEGISHPLDKKTYHYLKNVMRLKPDDIFSVFNGSQGEWRGRMDGGLLYVLGKERDNEVPVTDIWLLFAPLKKDNTDFIIQKGTELGVRLFQPVQTEFSNVSRVNREKLYLNAVEATEQCRRTLVPEIRDIVKLKEMLQSFPADRPLFFFDEKREGGTPLEVFDGEEGTKAAFLIGPEGGFSAGERDYIRSFSFVKPVSLSGSILRAETAVLAALASWHTVKGEWV